ncbi:hypothetical protein F5887DRAFT_983763 [Amanita rubescens]|nr:hypothetical protein F5887DRAFT_983763 [Amanita rubescens]
MPSSDEKKAQGDLLPLVAPASSKKRSTRFRSLLIVLGLVLCTLKLIDFAARGTTLLPYILEDSNNCPQTGLILPRKNRKLWNDLGGTVGSNDFQTRAVDWLGGAVRVPTESFDDFKPVGSDERWEKFSKFHEYLLAAFPSVHSTLTLTKVNTYGLLYVWQGKNPSLKPILLAAHQDVVPVDPSTWDLWTHPPFSGFFDGERIWGRGSSDDKSGLIGILSAIELLIECKFVPTRTVVLTFGFDEEASGAQGAGMLAKVLEDKFGKDGFAFIVDEGPGFYGHFGSVFATLGIAEKGYYDVKVEVASPGGHSSVPPPHTSIGILSSLLVHYENNPFKTPLKREDPVYGMVLCYGQHAKEIPGFLRWLINQSTWSGLALGLLEQELYKSGALKSLVGTTQAIDIVRGGVKANALPETAYAVVNHRISVLSSVSAVQSYDTERLKGLASSYNLTFDAFGNITDPDAPSSGILTLSDAFHTGLEPAPLTPVNATPYHLLSGTIKTTYNSHRSIKGRDNIYVAPGMMAGNTDTRYYWNLSQHIFRYNHQNAGNASDDVFNHIHTVDESISIDSFLEMIRFFTTLILNADESIAL